MQGLYLKLGHDHFLSHRSQSVIPKLFYHSTRVTKPRKIHPILKEEFHTSESNNKEIISVIPVKQQQKPNIPAGLMQV
jgi:hypothetical protein